MPLQVLHLLQHLKYRDKFRAACVFHALEDLREVRPTLVGRELVAHFQDHDHIECRDRPYSSPVTVALPERRREVL